MKLCFLCGQKFDGKGWQCPFCGHVPETEAGHYIFVPEMTTHDNGFDPNYFRDLANMEEGNWWFRSRNRLIIWALQHFFPQSKNFLEVGCGTGFVLSGIQEALPELSISGGELFMEGVTYAAHRLPHVPLFQMDSHRLPFEEEFDVIGAFDMLEHIDEDEEVLIQLFKATKKGGGIIITVPQHPFVWSEIDVAVFHKRRYTRKKLIQKVQKAGFDYIRCTSFVFLLFPLMLLVRKGKRDQRSESNVLEELKTGKWLGRMLGTVMDVERLIINAGVSLPFGGSLLLVAKRV